MSDRSYAVVVLPDAWGGSLEELASQMMPVTRRGPNQVLPLLERGPMTLEADLSVEEAGLLQARLNNLGVPAHVVGGDGSVVAASAHKGSQSESEPEPKPKPKPKPEPESAEGGEWGDVFASMDVDEEEPKKIKSLDELAGDSSDSFGAEPARKPPSPKPPSPKPPSPKPPSPKPPAQPPSPGPKGSTKPKPKPSPKPTSKRPDSFDAGKMSDALSAARGERPPYAPDGFDDSMSHIPAVAAALSLIAPGAGQIYNGQDEQAREFGVRFALVKPWYESVRQAYAYAEEVRTYWKPLPEAGSLVAAIKYLGVWWVIVGAVLAGLGWAGTTLYDVAKTPEAPKITKAQVGFAVEDARSKIQMARIGGLDGVSSYLDERSRNHERFTMSKDERAERLFRRGLVYCKEGNYATCESAMKRVSALSPKLRRDAYRLQAWASVQGESGGEGEPMPEVAASGSLEEFEKAQAADQPGANQPAANQQDADAGASTAVKKPAANKPDASKPEPSKSEPSKPTDAAEHPPDLSEVSP